MSEIMLKLLVFIVSFFLAWGANLALGKRSLLVWLKASIGLLNGVLLCLTIATLSSVEQANRDTYAVISLLMIALATLLLAEMFRRQLLPFFTTRPVDMNSEATLNKGDGYN